jgi:hypothetical protein
MHRLPTLHGLLVWGATFYLVAHGVVPPASSGAEARELAATFCDVGLAWLRFGWLRLRGLARA